MLVEPAPPILDLALPLVAGHECIKLLGVAGQVFQGHCGGLSYQRLAIGQSVQQRRNRIARAARGQRHRGGHTQLAQAVAQMGRQGRRGGRIAEYAQSGCGGDLSRGGITRHPAPGTRGPRRGRRSNLRQVTRAMQLGDQCRHFAAAARRIAGAVVAVDPGNFAVAVELQFHQPGHRGVIAPEPQRLAAAGQPQRMAPQRFGHRFRAQRRHLAVVMTADATPPLAGPHVDPRHLVQFGPAFGIDRLQRDRRIGRHFDGERTVRRQWDGAQVADLAARMDDVRMRRPDRQARTGQHTDGPDMRPAGRGLLGVPRVLAEQDTRRLGIAFSTRIYFGGQLHRSRPPSQVDRRMQRLAFGGVQHGQLRRPAVRVQDRNLLVTLLLDDLRLLALPDLARHINRGGTQQPAIGQRRHVASGDRHVLKVLGGITELADGDPGCRQERHPAIGQRGRAAAHIRPQAAPIFGPVVQAEFRVAAGTIRMDRVQQRLDFAAVEEVVRTDEHDPPVGQNLRLVIENDRVRQRPHVVAVGVHHVQ
jgi:hypothetical protein